MINLTNKTMAKKFEGDVPSQKNEEQENRIGLVDFFAFSEQEVEEEYTKPAQACQRKSGIEKKYQTEALIKELTRRFDNFIEQNDGQIPDSFFQDVLRIAKDYKLLTLRLRVGEQYQKADAALKFSQLCALIRHPEFIKDERSIAVMEELADLEHAEPWKFNMYTEYDTEKDCYILREGFGLEHLATFQKLIDNPKLWQGRNKAMRQVFFSSLAEAISLMSATNPRETLPLRLKLLEYNTEYGNYAEIQHYIVYTFKSDEDKAALKDILQARPASRIAQVIQKILSGGYNNILWL